MAGLNRTVSYTWAIMLRMATAGTGSRRGPGAFVLGVIAALSGCRAIAGDAAADSQLRWDYRVEFQAFLAQQELADSVINPGNVLGIPTLLERFELRPDVELGYGVLDLSAKPRLRGDWFRTEGPDGDERADSESDAYMNEWLARLRVTDELVASFGRENLQWGPAQLLSPSNPFNQDNGRNNLAVEVPGSDYARVTWIPGAEWSVSAIANTGKGELREPDFEERYAAKVDYTGSRRYFSVIPSWRPDDDRFATGVFGGVTISDAWLAYLEGTASEEESERGWLVGSSYTFRDGTNLVVEYFYRPDGCTTEPFAACLDGATGAAQPGDLLLRRNYLFVQAYRSFGDDQRFLTARWIADLDDDSDRLILTASQEIGDNVSVFLIANGFAGSASTEFGALLDYSLLLGLSCIF